MDAVAWAGVVAAVTAWLLRIAWPLLLPPGHGSGLTHRLLLVDYIERAGHLVHDRALEVAMGEMAHYTPGVAGLNWTAAAGPCWCARVEQCFSRRWRCWGGCSRCWLW